MCLKNTTVSIKKNGGVLQNGFKTIPLAFFQKLAQIGSF
jgi:hypothetical protein